MRKIVYFYNFMARYYTYPIENNIRILWDNKEKFKNYKLDVIPFSEYVDKLNNFQEELPIEEIKRYLLAGLNTLLRRIRREPKNYKNIILLAFHPIALTILEIRLEQLNRLKDEIGLKIIFWQDDLHAIDRGNMEISWVDKIITPSIKYFENTNNILIEKSHFFFYSMNFSVIPNINWDEREDKILLSGSNKGYPIRKQILNYIRRKKGFDEISVFIKKPKREYFYEKDIYVPVGVNYYKELTKYKGAFFGYYSYPLNFNLAKIIEILSCKCLGFFEYSSLLETELGLKPFIHYIPITDENGNLIEDIDYYKKYLNNKLSKKIVEAGYNHIKKYYCNEKNFINYVKIFKL